MYKNYFVIILLTKDKILKMKQNNLLGVAFSQATPYHFVSNSASANLQNHVALVIVRLGKYTLFCLH